MRWVRYLLAGSALLLVAAIVTLFIASSSTTGFAWLSRNVNSFVPGDLVIDEPGGSLLTSMRATNITYTLDTLHVAANDVDVRLNWAALIAGEIRFSRIDIADLRIDIADGQPTTAGDGLPDVDVPLALRFVTGRVGRLSINAPGFAESAERVRFSGALRGARLRVMQLRAEAYGFSPTLKGELTLRDGWRIDAEANWPETTVTSAGRPVTIGAGSMRADGRITDYAVTVTTPVTLQGLPEARLVMQLRGNTEALDIAQLTADSLNGRILASGRLVYDGFMITADIQAQQLDLGLLRAGLPQLASARVQVDGSLRGPIDIAIEQGTVQRGSNTADMSGRLVWNGNELTASSLQIAAGENRAEFSGRLLPAVAGSFRVTAPQLQQLAPEAAGSVIASGQIGGTAANAELRLDLSGEGLRWGTTSVSNLQLNAEGTADAFGYRVAGSAAEGQVQLAGTGAFTNDELAMTVATAELSYADWRGWQLADELRARVRLGANTSAPEIVLNAHCWVSAAMKTCIENARYSPEALALRAELTGVELDTLVPTYDDFALQGSGAASLDVSGTLAAPVARLSWRQEGTRLIWRDDEGQELETGFSEVVAELRLQNNALTYNAVARGTDGIELSLEGDSSAIAGMQTPIDVRLQANVADIRQIAPFLERYTGLDDPSGRLRADISADGRLDAPLFTGAARLEGGRAVVRALGITLTDIDMALGGQGARALDITGSARSGDGQVSLTGNVAWPIGESLIVTLDVAGENFTALQFPQQIITASPDLRLQFSGRTLNVTGTVVVPYADIAVETVPETAAAPSSDVVVVRSDAESAQRRPGLIVVSDIDLRLGENVRLQAFGLETGLRGQLRLYTTAENQQPYLEGNVRSAGGNFEAFGREFTIDRGVLIYNGAPDNPNVDLRAVRSLRYQGEDIRIVVQLTGPLEDMQTRLSGEPAMSETDALSFLVLNRPAQRGDNLRSEEMSAAAVALGLVNLLPATEQLRNTFGLDEFEFAGTTRENSAVTAGKRIADDLYLRYSYGLFKRIGRIIVRYDIGRGFSLEAGSGEEQTIDLLYSIDR